MSDAKVSKAIARPREASADTSARSAFILVPPSPHLVQPYSREDSKALSPDAHAAPRSPFAACSKLMFERVIDSSRNPAAAPASRAKSVTDAPLATDSKCSDHLK